MSIIKSKAFWGIAILIVAIYFLSKKKKESGASYFNGIPEKRYQKHEVVVNKSLAIR